MWRLSTSLSFLKLVVELTETVFAGPEVHTRLFLEQILSHWRLMCLSVQNTRAVVFQKMQFLLRQQRYLECIHDGRILEALNILRQDLTPLDYNTPRIHELSWYVVAS